MQQVKHVDACLFLKLDALLPPLHEKALAHTLCPGASLRSNEITTDHAQFLEIFPSQDLTLPPVAHFHCDLHSLCSTVQRQTDRHRHSRVN